MVIFTGYSAFNLFALKMTKTVKLYAVLAIWSAIWLKFVWLILFFTSHQQSFSYKGTGLPVLNKY